MIDINKADSKLSELITERSNINTVFDLIEKYVMPFRGDFYQQEHSENAIDWRDQRDVYDTTAIDSNETLSASIQGNLTSLSTKFFEMRFRQEELNQDQESLEWLQTCGNRVYNALQDSNFDLESSEFYLELTGFGTAAIVEEVENEIEWSGLDFGAIPIRECYFELDHKGNVIRFWRILKWTATQIISKFGKENLPSDIAQKIDEDSVDKHEVVFHVSLVDENKNADISKVLSPEKRPYQRCYYFRGCEEKLGDYGGYYEMPVFIARWRKAPSSKWGFSPAFVCMGAILSLNQIEEDTLEALGKVIDPATLATRRGLVSDLDIGRAGLTIVRNIDDIKPYESRARFDVGEMKVQNLQRDVRRAYRVDQLELKESPQMTALEVNVRYELMQRLLGPTMGRLQNDFLDRMIKRTFNVLYRAKRMPAPPQKVVDAEAEFDVEYVGPMARAQRKQIVNAVYEWMGGIGELAKIKEEIMDVPNTDLIAKDMANLMGVPAKYANSEDEITAIRKRREEAEQATRQVGMMDAAGQAAKSVGEGMEKLGVKPNVQGSQ